MNRRLWLVLLVLIVLLTACTDAPPPTPTLLPATPTPAPTSTATATPTFTPVPTATITASPSASPTAVATPSAAPTATATASPGAVSEQLAADLQRTLERIRVDNSIPGISASVIMPDGSRWAGVGGQSSLDPPADVGVDTPFVAGSITKTFVAATIMSLVDEGALSIDDHLSKWLPDYPRADGITLRHLLSHTSGVYDYFEHPSYNRLVFGNPTRVWTPQEVLDTLVLDPYCDPGTCYHYSNTGFLLLGLVVEAQMGETLGDVLRDRWFSSVGLAHTSFQDGPPLPSDAAYGHLLRLGDRMHEFDDGTDYRPTTSAATVAWAVGAVESTATDLATWADALYGGHLLSAESVAEMTDFAANPYSDESYGLGTRTRSFRDRQMVGHTGSLRGYYAAMWHYPAENLTVVIELNLGRIDPNPMADALAAVALDAAGYPPPAPSPTLLPSAPASPSTSTSP